MVMRRMVCDKAVSIPVMSRCIVFTNLGHLHDDTPGVRWAQGRLAQLPVLPPTKPLASRRRHHRAKPDPAWRDRLAGNAASRRSRLSYLSRHFCRNDTSVHYSLDKDKHGRSDFFAGVGA